MQRERQGHLHCRGHAPRGGAPAAAGALAFWIQVQLGGVGLCQPTGAFCQGRSLARHPGLRAKCGNPGLNRRVTCAHITLIGRNETRFLGIIEPLCGCQRTSQWVFAIGLPIPRRIRRQHESRLSVSLRATIGTRRLTEHSAHAAAQIDVSNSRRTVHSSETRLWAAVRSRLAPARGLTQSNPCSTSSPILCASQTRGVGKRTGCHDWRCHSG